MGSWFARLFDGFREREGKILMLGLDNSGKTTSLYRLQVGEVVETIPTVGFEVETLVYDQLKLHVWDLGGQESIRPYWRCYYGRDTDAIIFVVDSTDEKRIGDAQKELFALLEEEELSDAVVCVFANKQDRSEDALSVEAIVRRMALGRIRNRTFQVFGTSAVTGEGLDEGMKWSRILALLRRHGFESMTLQHGRGPSPVPFSYSPDADSSHAVSLTSYDSYDFRPTLGPDFAKADLVITHCGAGCVSEALRHTRWVIAVVNETLQENHQTELAREYARRDHIVRTTVGQIESLFQQDDFLDSLRRLKRPEPPRTEHFAAVIDQELGLADD